MTARILIFTGPGAGKTSAALGKVLRLVGHGRRVVVVRFLKSGASGELSALERLGVPVHTCGLGFVRRPGSPPIAEHRQAAQAGLELARDLLAEVDALMLDEVCGAVSLGVLDEAPVLDLLRQVRPGQVCLCTGRDASPGLIAAADTVSELGEIKHAYRAGVPAMAGVES